MLVMVVVVVLPMLLGTIWPIQVFVTKNVSHTLLVKVTLHHADQHVLMVVHSQDIRHTKSTVSHLFKVNKVCKQMVQLKHVSMFIKIS